ncbi:MAG: competence/damage-inducible protein A [Oscillospiraceae bacterium]|nr:competence/damage-inducible protein A [Oscillospiraceae bacterium]
MKSMILSVGTELLFGQIVNTNSVYLSQQLNSLGLDVLHHHTVGDNPRRLAEVIEHSLRDCDIIIATGGLGPTQDDLTKEVVSEVMGDTLLLDKEILEKIKALFKKINRDMTENNIKQAYLPSRATVFHNDVGSAPGFALADKGKVIICMPGPPRELKPMFENYARPYLEKLTDSKIYYRMIKTFGAGESWLETELFDLIDNQTDPTIATYAKEGECALRIASKRSTEAEAAEAVNAMTAQIKERIGELIYSLEDESLYEVVGKLLIEKNISISCAESCTGGLFSEYLTRVSGISAVFDRTFITYSNCSKIDELGVNPETIKSFGAVSAEVALEKARGVKAKSGSRLCISVTGVAGPGGGTADKPVGLSYIGLVFDDFEDVKEIRSRYSDREANRYYSMLCMMHMIYGMLTD